MSPVFVTTPFLVQKALKTANFEKGVFFVPGVESGAWASKFARFPRKPAPRVCRAEIRFLPRKACKFQPAELVAACHRFEKCAKPGPPCAPPGAARSAGRPGLASGLRRAPSGPGLRGSTPAFQSRRRESEAQRRPPAAGVNHDLLPCTSPACQPLDLSRAKEMARSSCFLRLRIAANSPRTGTVHRYLPCKSGGVNLTGTAGGRHGDGHPRLLSPYQRALGGAQGLPGTVGQGESLAGPAGQQTIKAEKSGRPPGADRPQRGYNSFVPLEPVNQLQVDLADMAFSWSSSAEHHRGGLWGCRPRVL